MERSGGLFANDSHPFCVAAHQSPGRPLRSHSEVLVRGCSSDVHCPGAERRLTNFPLDFDICDFDVSPDGGEVVLERVQERSNVVLLDLPRP